MCAWRIDARNCDGEESETRSNNGELSAAAAAAPIIAQSGNDRATAAHCAADVGWLALFLPPNREPAFCLAGRVQLCASGEDEEEAEAGAGERREGVRFAWPRSCSLSKRAHHCEPVANAADDGDQVNKQTRKQTSKFKFERARSASSSLLLPLNRRLRFRSR